MVLGILLRQRFITAANHGIIYQALQESILRKISYLSIRKISYKAMSVIITDNILRQANMTESEFKLELGLFLFVRGILSMGKASEFVEISQFEFQKAMNERGIPVSYDEEEFDKDFEKVMAKYRKP